MDKIVCFCSRDSGLKEEFFRKISGSEIENACAEFDFENLSEALCDEKKLF